MTKNAGGFAFPFAVATQDNNGQPLRIGEIETGMSLRDWFAGQALPEIIRIASAGDLEALDGENAGQAIARSAYEAADAMLAERSRKPRL